MFRLVLFLCVASRLAAAEGDPVNDLRQDGQVGRWLLLGPFPSAALPFPGADGASRVGYHRDFLAALGGEGAAVIAVATRLRDWCADPIEEVDDADRWNLWYALRLAAALERGGNLLAEDRGRQYPVAFAGTDEDGAARRGEYAIGLPAGLRHGAGSGGHIPTGQQREALADAHRPAPAGLVPGPGGAARTNSDQRLLALRYRVDGRLLDSPFEYHLRADGTGAIAPEGQLLVLPAPPGGAPTRRIRRGPG